MWQTKYAFAVPENLGLGVDFRPCSEGDFLTGRSYSVTVTKKLAMFYRPFSYHASVLRALTDLLTSNWPKYWGKYSSRRLIRFAARGSRQTMTYLNLWRCTEHSFDVKIGKARDKLHRDR